MPSTPPIPDVQKHALPSYLQADHLGPWGNYLKQVDRVTPYLGHLSRWVETLKRPKRILVVDVPIELDNGTIAHYEGYRVNKDIPAPDVNTNEQVMAWMMDTYSMNTGSTATGVVTGKPVDLGGSLGRREATGRGVYTVGMEAAHRIGLEIQGARVAVQGFGNVGGTAAQLFAESGARVVAVQDHTGTIYREAGLDAAALMAHVQDTGGAAGFAGAEVLDNDAFWGVPCDILIPAALESQITADNAGQIQARLVIEGANGPTTPEADDILHDKGVLVLPDVIANAGGVTVSYFEWVQDFSSFFWTEEEINARLVRIMKEAFAGIWDMGQKHGVSLRTATFIIACTRMLHARELRGLYP